MAYLVAQIRHTDINNNNAITYKNTLDVKADTIFSQNPFDLNTKGFEDFCLKATETFKASNTYIIRFKIKRIPLQKYQLTPDDQSVNYSILNISLCLRQSDKDQSQFQPQEVGSLVVPSSNSKQQSKSQYSFFSFVFTPIITCDTLVFKIKRNRYDAICYTQDNYRKWLIEDYEVSPRIYYGQQLESDTFGQVSQLVNLVNLSEISKNTTQWLKIGYQSRPGSLIVVNHQPIRVGRSGIYEINNGLKISSFMIGSSNTEGQVDPFLLDYAYSSTSS